MTALSARPDHGDPGAYPRSVERDGAERRIIGLALAAAALLHLLAVLLPLPERAEAVPLPPPRVPPQIIRTPIPPPKIDPPEVRVVESRTRREPLPVEMTVPSEPVDEPLPSISPEPWEGEPFELLPVDPLPPEPRGPVEDGTEGLIPPRAIERPEPEYPRMAVTARLEGVVMLRAVITAEGSVESIEVLSVPQPDFGFSDAAVEAVLRWHYLPGMLNGRPVAVSMRVIVEFHLD